MGENLPWMEGWLFIWFWEYQIVDDIIESDLKKNLFKIRNNLIKNLSKF